MKTKVKTATGQVHQIPEAWLMGACLRLRRQGLGYLEAYQQAVAEWMGQEEMEQQFKAKSRRA